MEVKARNTKKKFDCTKKDKIMFNGHCYQLVTQDFIRNWYHETPVVSKTEFNRLLKENALSEPYEVKYHYSIVTMYDFIKE